MSIKRLSGAGLTTPKSSRLWDQTTFQSGMFALATISLTSSQSSVTFSGIPANYTHLQLRIMGISSANANTIGLQFNGDTSTNYTFHQLYGDGATLAGTGGINGTNAGVGMAATVVSPNIIHILDYANTSKLKTIKGFGGYDNNGSGYAVARSSLWYKAGSGVTSDAITSIKCELAGGTWSANAHFALYGIKVA